jgi:hypothetical protein
MAMATVSKCTGPDMEDGPYVWCDGTNDALYHSIAVQPDCHLNLLNPYACMGQMRRFSLCLGSDQWQYGGTGGEGGTGEGPINLANWHNDTEAIEYIQSLCEAKCRASGGGECDQTATKKWRIQNYQAKYVPDLLNDIDDPWHLECTIPVAKIALAPEDTTVIASTISGIAWLSDPLGSISLQCHDFGTCAEDFVAPINAKLYYDDTEEPWGENMGHADYLATTSTTSSTMISFTIANPTTGASSAMHEAEGRIEYSIADCGQPECAFYLGNLSFTNSTDT